jgi:predicted nucleic acid-binding protein
MRWLKFLSRHCFSDRYRGGVGSYKFSYYDSQIIASALEHQCEILYSEDMQDGQVIEHCLRIINPFSRQTG